MPTILVTGAAGFIGSHVCEAILALGDRVCGLDNFDNFYGASLKRANLLGLMSSPRFRFYDGDIRDENVLDQLLRKERPDAVVHLAARAGVRDSINEPKLYYDINLNGTLTLLEAMRRNCVTRLVFASSSSVYGGLKETPFSEALAIRPICPYAATKAAGESLCSTYAELYAFSVVCCRFFTVYGPRQRPDMAITKFTEAMIKGRPMTLYGDGSSTRDYTFVSDIVQGIIAALNSECVFEILNLGSTSPIRLSRVIELLSQELRVVPKVEFAQLQRGEPAVTLANITKAQNVIGYNPKIPFEIGIHQFVRWYLNHASLSDQDTQL